MKRFNINKLKYFSVVILLFGVLGCEDIIEVDLNSANQQVVIEAEINDRSTISSAVITKTTDYFTPGIYDKVSDAVVTISDNSGNSAVMHDFNDGTYQTDLIRAKENEVYFIDVDINGKLYSAISTMPSKIILDSLSLEEAPDRPGKDEGSFRIFLHIYFQDNPEIENYCRFKINVNNNYTLTGFNIYSDKLTNGNSIDYRIVLTSENGVKLGDLIRVDLLSIDKAAYDFYKTASSINASGGGREGPSSNSGTPANPISNWNNNALGFFTAYTVSSKSIELKK